MANKNIFILNPLAVSKGIFYLRFLLIFAFIAPAQFIQAQAKAEVKEPKKNFGDVKRGEIVSHQFEIKNVGTAPLIIDDAEVACSCTTVDFPEAPILPNTTAMVTVTFNTKTVYGRQDRIVILRTNGSQKTVKLRFKANVSTE